LIGLAKYFRRWQSRNGRGFAAKKGGGNEYHAGHALEGGIF